VSVHTPRTLLTHVRNPACNPDALYGAGRLLQEGADQCGVHVQYVVQTLAPGSFSAELLLTSTQQVPPRRGCLLITQRRPLPGLPLPCFQRSALTPTSSGRSLRCAQAPVPAWLLAWSFAAAAVAHVAALQGGALLNLSTPAAPQQFALASLPGVAPLAPGAGARARLSVRAADGGVGQAPLIDAVSMQGLACPAQAPSSPAAAGGQGAAAAPAPPPACGASAPAGAPDAAWSPAAALPGAQPPCALSFCCPPVPALAPSGLLSGAAGALPAAAPGLLGPAAGPAGLNAQASSAAPGVSTAAAAPALPPSTMAATTAAAPRPPSLPAPTAGLAAGLAAAGAACLALCAWGVTRGARRGARGGSPAGRLLPWPTLSAPSPAAHALDPGHSRGAAPAQRRAPGAGAAAVQLPKPRRPPPPPPVPLPPPPPPPPLPPPSPPTYPIAVRAGWLPSMPAPGAALPPQLRPAQAGPAHAAGVRLPSIVTGGPLARRGTWPAAALAAALPRSQGSPWRPASAPGPGRGPVRGWGVALGARSWRRAEGLFATAPSGDEGHSGMGGPLAALAAAVPEASAGAACVIEPGHGGRAAVRAADESSGGAADVPGLARGCSVRPCRSSLLQKMQAPACPGVTGCR